MPVLTNKDSITGFGSDGAQVKCWKCPKDHMLQPWISAGVGSCDGCHQKVYDGERVMDCRRCNWYLCERCHPQEHDSSIWGSIASAFDTAAQDMSSFSDNFHAEIGAVMSVLTTCSAPDKEAMEFDEIDFYKHGKAEADTNGAAPGEAPGSKAGCNAESEHDDNGSEDCQTATPEEPVEARVPEDLIEIGQHDLLDLSDPVPAPTADPADADALGAPLPPQALPTVTDATPSSAAPFVDEVSNTNAGTSTDLLSLGAPAAPPA